MSKHVIRRKKEQVTKILQDREEASIQSKKEFNDSWFKHWDRSDEQKGPKSLGGSRRPKYFSTDSIDFEVN